MKITLTKRDRLAVCFHVVQQRVDNLEQAKLRRLLWKALDVVDIAADVADLISAGGGSVGTGWFDRTESHEFELETAVAEFLKGATRPPYAGIHGEYLLDIHERLEAKG